MELQNLQVILQSSSYCIWRGEDSVLRSRFTVKELLGSAASNPVYLDRLEEEAKFSEQFAYSRILALVKRYSEGVHLFEDTLGSLEQLVIHRGKLPNEQVAGILAQILEGLAHLHSRAFAHGTLCLQNVFVDPHGGAKLGDFVGYRYERDRPRLNQERLPKHQPPEVIDNQLGRCGPGSDLYCLGFLALEMLSGPEFPGLFGFSGDQIRPQQWLRWHANYDTRLQGWQALVPEVSKALGDFIDGLIEKQPKKRPFGTALMALKRLNELGLQSRRVISSFEPRPRVATVSETSEYSPPQRKLGPILWLRARKTALKLKDRRIPHDKPLLVNSSQNCGEEGIRKRRLALLSCQENHWFLYNISESSSSLLFNRNPVTKDKP